MTARKTSRRKAGRNENDDGYSKFRTRWRHVLLIDQQIRAEVAPNCTKLAQELEVSRRTILRDIDFMKCDLGAPLDYDPKKRGYIYTEPNWVMPSVRITEGELFALMVAEKALEAYSGTPWAERLHQVFGRMIASLPDRIEVVPQEMLSRVSFDTGGAAEFNPVVLDTLAKAVSQNHTIELEYRPLGAQEPKSYTIDPYVLSRMRGAWYLAGRKHPDGNVPLFNLSRVCEVKDTGKTFDFDQARFDSEKYFKSTFGAFQSNEVLHIVVEFSGTAADLVRERQWHKSQKLTERPGGRLRFEVDISHLYDILSWVLSWGAGAKVIAPKELVRIVADQAAQAARQYKRYQTERNEDNERI